MKAILKKRKIIMWITLIVAIATQAFGWYITMAIGAKGKYKFIGEVVPGMFFVIAAIATVASVIFAILSGKGDAPGKGVMTGVMLFSTIAAAASVFGADIAYLLVGKVPLIALLAFCCLILGIVNLVFSIKAVNAVKSSGSRSQT